MTITDTKQTLAESILGPVEWTGPDTGFATCPGLALHTTHNSARNGKPGRDCRVTLNGAPTIYCVHQSCRGAVDQANRALRSAIGKASVRTSPSQPAVWRPSADDLRRRQERELAQQEEKRRQEAAARSKAKILADFAIDPVELLDASPVPLPNDPLDDWRLHLRLFHPEDVVWMGAAGCSGHPQYADHFRRVVDWLAFPRGQAPFNSPLTCPSTFKPGSYSRSNANVVRRRYLVIESDTLTKPEICAVFQWCRQFMRLRAIVDTAGKSLHGWFEQPSDTALSQLRDILPALGCDPALFKPAQPCRLPGAVRASANKSTPDASLPYGWHEDRTQTLLYLDLEAIRHE